MRQRLIRLWQSVCMTFLSSVHKKHYSENNKIFALYGNHVTYQPKVIPLYPQLIKLHDNVVVGRNVEFVTHDVIHVGLNAMNIAGGGFTEMCGCIEVMDGSFIGNGSIIMYGVKIAEGNIIAAGSVVTKSTEPFSVYAGVPAKKICDLADFAKKRKTSPSFLVPVKYNTRISEDEVREAWRKFEEHISYNSGGRG